MFYYPPPPPPPANIFHLAPGPYCSIPGPVGISGLFTFNPNPAPTASTEEKAAKEKPKAPKKKILIPPLPPLLPPPPPLPAAEGKKEKEKKDEESLSVAKEGSKAKEKDKPKEEEKEKGQKKEEKKKKKKVINTYLPPQIPKGTNFWFAAEFTRLHIFNKGVRIWEEKWRGDRKYVCFFLSFFVFSFLFFLKKKPLTYQPTQNPQSLQSLHSRYPLAGPEYHRTHAEP